MSAPHDQGARAPMPTHEGRPVPTSPTSSSPKDELREASQALLAACIEDFGLSDDDGDDEAVAAGIHEDGSPLYCAVTFGHMRRVQSALSLALSGSGEGTGAPASPSGSQASPSAAAHPRPECADPSRGWQDIASAPLDGTEMLLAFLCPLTGLPETSPGYYDDGTDDEGKPFEEPAWFIFDKGSVEVCQPVAWQPYPSFASLPPVEQEAGR